MMAILCEMVGKDESIINELKSFFKGSENVKLLAGKIMYCG